MAKRKIKKKRKLYLSQKETLAKLLQPKLKHLAKRKKKAYLHQQRLNELHATE